MIFPKVSLSYKKTARFENAVNYMKEETFVNQYRQSVFKAFVKLAKTKLNGIRIAKTEVIKMKAIMKIDNDLIESFKTYDVYTKNATSVVFDAKTAFRISQNHEMIVKDI